MPVARRRLSLTDAALRLGLGYHQTRDLLLRGRLRGGKDEAGRYFVDARDLERVRRERVVSVARPQPATA